MEFPLVMSNKRTYSLYSTFLLRWVSSWVSSCYGMDISRSPWSVEKILCSGAKYKMGWRPSATANP